jgi:hypothetical protein
MKKLFFLNSLFILAAGLGLAQNDNVSSNSISFKAKVGSVIESLGEGKTYKVIPPDEVSPVQKRFSSFNQGLGLDAKRVKGEEKSDKVFKIVTTGFADPTRFEDQPYQDLNSSGFVRKVYFRCPMKLIVSNANGEVEKEIIVISEDDEVSEVFHAGTATGTTGSGFSPIPFKTAELLNQEYEQKKAATLDQLEKEAIGNTLIPKIKQVVNVSYGMYKFPLGFISYYVPSKSAASSNPELLARCNELKVNLTDLNDKTKEEAAMKRINDSYDYFQKSIAANTVDPSLLQIYLGNAALTGLISGHLAEAEDHFSKFYFNYADKNRISNFSSVYESLYGMYSTYYALKQTDQKIVKLNYRPKAFEEKRKSDEQKAMAVKAAADSVARANALPVYKGEMGTVYLSEPINTETIVRGKIYYDFNQTSVTSKEKITIPSKLIIETSNGKGELLPRSISYFVVDNKKYVSTELKGGGFLKVAAVAAGNLQGKEFWQVLQENDKASYLELPGKEMFAILLEGEKEAYSVNDIIKNRKPAKDFYTKCPQLLEAINKKEIKSVETRQDFKEFYNWLQANCK